MTGGRERRRGGRQGRQEGECPEKCEAGRPLVRPRKTGSPGSMYVRTSTISSCCWCRCVVGVQYSGCCPCQCVRCPLVRPRKTGSHGSMYVRISTISSCCWCCCFVAVQYSGCCPCQCLRYYQLRFMQALVFHAVGWLAPSRPVVVGWAIICGCSVYFAALPTSVVGLCRRLLNAGAGCRRLLNAGAGWSCRPWRHSCSFFCLVLSGFTPLRRRGCSQR